MYNLLNYFLRNKDMMFSPKIYSSLNELRDASIMDAHSDTITKDLEVFGYFDGKPYQAQYVFCTISEATYAVAGDCITE